MSTRSINLDEKLYQYFQQHAFRDDEILAELRRVTAEMPESIMQISPEQGAFMTMMVSLLGAKRIIEVGTFTGYSSLCMARALPADGLITALDNNAEWTAIAQRFWLKAGVEDKVNLKLGAAVDSLKLMLDEGHQATIDLIFIDADKANYMNYYNLVIEKLKPGGYILADNVLWSGKVIEEVSPDDADTLALKKFNTFVQQDERVENILLPVRDGLMLIRKK